MKRKMLVEKMIIIQCLEVTINRGSLSMLTLKSHCVQFNLLPGKCSWDCSLRSFECNRFFFIEFLSLQSVCFTRTKIWEGWLIKHGL